MRKENISPNSQIDTAVLLLLMVRQNVQGEVSDVTLSSIDQAVDMLKNVRQGLTRDQLHFLAGESASLSWDGLD